jgi:hypothetical protein
MQAELRLFNGLPRRTLLGNSGDRKKAAVERPGRKVGLLLEIIGDMPGKMLQTGVKHG